jgi:GT2 family glycosyltransferase
VAVLVATRDRRADVLETLDAVAALDHPPEALEVLVLDNASSDGTEAAVRAWIAGGAGRRLARAECLRSADNVGASGARNLLAAAASPGTGFLFLLDDDAVPHPALLRAALGLMAAEPRLGVVGVRIVAWDDPARELAGAGFVDWRWGRFREVRAARGTDCDFVISCAAVVRSEAFRAAGGFDEDYFVYHEDVDFCVRVRRAGWRVRYEPSVAARHKVPPGKTRTRERLYYVLRNKFLFLHKHLPPARHPLPWLAYGAGLVPAMVLRSLAVNRRPVPEELGTILRAARDGLAGRTGQWRR